MKSKLTIAELYGVPNSHIIAVTLNIRILKALSGVIQGESLSQLHPGYIYQVSEALGHQLIALDAAVEVRSTDPTSDDIDIARLTGGIHVVPPERAEDRPEKRRRKRR